MMCTELQHEDADEDVVVYGDQGNNTEEYEKATYGDLMKTQSEEEEEVKCNVALCTNDSVLLFPTKMYTMLVRVTFVK